MSNTLETSPPAGIATEDAATIGMDKACSRYTNFCSATGTPEELILEFGLATDATGAPDPAMIGQRVVVNYFTAKRFLYALQISIQRHEEAFGRIEPIVEKRLVPTSALSPARP